MTMTTTRETLYTDEQTQDMFVEAEADAVADTIWQVMEPLRGDGELAQRFQAYVPQTPSLEVPRYALPTRHQNTRHRIFWKADGKLAGGSYKGRGMFSDVLGAELEAEQTGEPFTEIVVGSTGNHAAQAALVGTLREKRVTVYMPEGTVQTKQDNVRRFGGNIIFLADLDECLAAAAEHGERPGARFVHPFDTPRVIAGQGTAALELYEQLLAHGVDADKTPLEYIVPAGGGGNLTGQAVALERQLPGSMLRFVQSAGAAALVGIKNNKPFTGKFDASVDGAAVRNPGAYASVLARSDRYVHSGMEATDGQVAEAMNVVRKFTDFYEPAGVLAMAGILAEMDADIEGARLFAGHGSGMNTTFDKVAYFAAAGVREGRLDSAEEFDMKSDARLRLGRMANALEEQAMETTAAQEAARQAARPVRSGTRVASGSW
ncbi:MAG TPA: pyridoxal-phosphate dependent enzyme [Candidatus Saccharimonadales bacterium]|nr:pyridoxal-phosphate dependent enzyme [Candidatus Saccharimonadales bacterium]